MPGRGRVDAARFAMVPRPDVPRSAFDIPFTHKTTLEAPALTPIYVDEVLPGDSLRLSMTGFARLATPLVPVMDNLYMETFFFFVPSRLLWDKWARFMGEQDNITDQTDFLVPQITIDQTMAFQGSLANYMGLIKPAVGQTYTVSALPFRAYNMIFNEWFRDQDLQNPVVENKGDGPDSMADYAILPRLKRPDYFTSCRPWPQKPASGSTFATSFLSQIYVPGSDALAAANSVRMDQYGAGAPVTGIGVATGAGGGGGVSTAYTGSRTATPAEQYSSDLHVFKLDKHTGVAFPDVRVLVNDIRTSVMIQHMLERNARGGTRYVELVESHFGVRSPDMRLQRPEYLGGGRSMVHISPVAQTAPESGGSTVLGELGAFGTVVANGHGFSASFTEHGWIIGLVNVRPDVSYQAGVNRMWFRRTIVDHYWPSLAHLGEQAVLKREIWTDGNAADEDVFGYQERWSEYKWKPNLITGFFQSWAATPLDVWHLAEHFAARPSLNSAFVQQTVGPVDRVLQVATVFGEQLLADFSFNLRWVRPMPMFSVPGVVGRF